MPFLRFTRDSRGYENTFLLHIPGPGARPRVLYWYRSAPAVRVGRPALDEDAIRTIEEQHPDIEFDWPHILEVGAATAPEVEAPPARPRRKAERIRETAPAEAPAAARGEEMAEDQTRAGTAPGGTPPESALEAAAPGAGRPHDLLEELVGHEIATRLRARYAEITARIHQLPVNEAARTAWLVRAERLDPDSWVTPDEILHGVSRADALFDALRRELLG